MSDEATGLARTLADWSEEFAAGQRTYFAHVRGLVLPGREVSVPNVDQVAPGPITEWDEAGRRCVVLHTGRVVRGGGVFSVTAAPGCGATAI